MYESSRARVLGAVLVAVTLGLAGCTNDPAKPKPLPSPTSSSPSASPSESAPTMPAAAKGTGDAAAEAFARHYVDLINYAMHTGETTQMRDVSAPDCATCTTIAKGIEKVYAGSGHMEKGDWRPEKTEPALPLRGANSHIRMRIHILRQTIYKNADASPSAAAPTSGSLDFYLERTNSGWIVEHLVAKA